ncbi:MAG: hypothetical protein FWC91_01910 [Defluviitaleaceae bacterium]|nr:hypothetical protein [Defluviitaleaceae bacterium]
MTSVGIIGGNSNETAALFLRICQRKGLTSLANLYEISKNNEVPIVCIDENASKSTRSLPEVWIIQDNCDYNAQANNLLKEVQLFIVNADNPIMQIPNGRGIITYGFNSKASVTASSVTDGAMQVCIQRGFKTLGERFYEPQEFKVSCPIEVNPLNVLGAVTACAVCDIFTLS